MPARFHESISGVCHHDLLPVGHVTQGDHVRADRPWRSARAFSSIRTVTVGSGLSPDLLDPSDGRRSRAHSAGLHTAGEDFHPALRTRPACPVAIAEVNRI